MKTIQSKVLMHWISVILLAGCSVKENRDVCPCRLMLDFSSVDRTVMDFADLFVTADDAFVFEDRIEAENFGEETMVSVPRREILVMAWGGTEEMLGEQGLSIPLGEDCPPVYIHTSRVDADCELFEETVCMRKNHCRLNVSLNNVSEGEIGVCLFGNVNGYSPEGVPLRGDFEYDMQADGINSFNAVLPRQFDNSLALEINDGSSVLKRFAIGEYIAESGYDWTEPDLKDISIDIDVVFSRVILSVVGWDYVYRFEVVI